MFPFSPSISHGSLAHSTAFIQSRSSVNSVTPVPSSSRGHSAGCGCVVCSLTSSHPAGCACAACARGSRTVLYAETTETAKEVLATDEDVPAEVEAMDGINSEDEAHNAERPARKSLKKKGPKGTPLSEYSVGDTVSAKVKTLASYGAFMDIGAETDGLLHISNLSVDFVSDINEVLEVGKEYDVRITKLDEAKKQVSLSLLSEAQEEEAAANARPAKRERAPTSNNRRDDSAVVVALQEKGWDPEQFVEGTVVSTVDFGAFVRIDCSQLNSEVEGELDGLVHISALAARRVDSVTSVVNPNDKVQVRVKSIDNRKVSLSMVSVEDEKAKQDMRGGGGGSGREPAFQGNKDWKKSLEKIQEEMPKFENKPLIVDNRK